MSVARAWAETNLFIACWLNALDMIEVSWWLLLSPLWGGFLVAAVFGVLFGAPEKKGTEE